MSIETMNYQSIVNVFNNEYEIYFGSNKVEYLDFEIWYLIYLRAKQSNIVEINSLKEMANILYNSYIIFKNNYEENSYYKKIKKLDRDLNSFNNIKR